jgi:hypothetical protein
LLGSESHDIDVALEDMMGYPFAEYFVSFVESKDLPVKSVVKIESNPDQSKHLETARTTVLGVELDFVNLRSEEYAGDSRIPTQVVSRSQRISAFSPRTEGDDRFVVQRSLERRCRTLCGGTLPSTRYFTTCIHAL